MSRICLMIALVCWASIAASQSPSSLGGIVQEPHAKPLPVVVSCGLPKADSITENNGIWTFILRNGDTGKCTTDITRAPQRERAEISSERARFAQGARFRVATLYQAETGAARLPETFILQLHQWREDCQCAPPLMLSFDARGQLTAYLLRSEWEYNRYELAGWTRRRFAGRWVEIALDVTNRKGKSDLTIYVAGKQVLQEKMLILQPDALYFKSGLYRVGHETRILPSDRAYATTPNVTPLN